MWLTRKACLPGHDHRCLNFRRLRGLALVLFMSACTTVGIARSEWAPGNPAVPGTYASSIALDINADGAPDVQFDPQGAPGSGAFLVTPLWGGPDRATSIFVDSGGGATYFQSRDEILDVPPHPPWVTLDSAALPASFSGALGYLGIQLIVNSQLPDGTDEVYAGYFLIETTPSGLRIVDSGYQAPQQGGVGGGDIPPDFWLAPASPNPFRVSTKIAFGLASDSDAMLDIFGATGQLVRHLWAGRLTRGRHVVVWDGQDENGMRAAAGTYFYRILSAGDSKTGKLIVSR